jgi:hypothetical protein
MDNKTLSIVSYITVFGWLISFVLGKDKPNSLLKYHLKQSLDWLYLPLSCRLSLKFYFQLQK